MNSLQDNMEEQSKLVHTIQELANVASHKASTLAGKSAYGFYSKFVQKHREK